MPWLKTVVKHEAFALRKQRERHGLPSDREPEEASSADTHEQVERLDRLQQGAEALRRLKPQEIRCILLLAEGHSYKQIQEITGFSYTKVNRCLSEGRRSFLLRVEGIEAGAECERLAPLVSALAGGVASADDIAVLRPHLRTCLACRSALRDAREASPRVAAVAPAGLLIGSHGWSFRGVFEWVNARVTSLALRGQELIETASAHKAAAAVASAAALGGGVAAVEATRHDLPLARQHRQHRTPRPVVTAAPAQYLQRPLRAQSAARVPARPRRSAQRRPAATQTAAPPSPGEFEVAPAAPARKSTPRAEPPVHPLPQTGEFGP